MTNNRRLGMELLEDRKLMTVMAEFVDLVEPDQIGSEHWPEPAAEIAVEEMRSRRLSLHNNGAFLPWHRGYIKSTMDTPAEDAGTNSDSGRETSYAYELKNVQVTSIVDQKEIPVKNRSDTNIPNYTEVQWTFRTAATDIVMQQLEHGPGMHDSVHCLTGQHDRPGQLVNKLGGQEGEPVNVEPSGLNFEEIKVTFTDRGNDKIIGIPSSPELEASTDVVFGQLARLEHGPGLHDSVHCLLGGQEGEAVNNSLLQDLRPRNVSAENLGDQVSVIWPDF